MNFTYKTLDGPTEALFRDRGSKFLGYAYPASRSDTIKKYIQDLKKAHPKANHHCLAYRLGTEGLQYRANDDGEPSGSAGRPILGQIDRAGLTDVLIVVVRYFGGTLLGIPGLINAYKHTAAECISKGNIVEKAIEYKLQIQFEYPVLNEVMRILKQMESTIYKQDMGLFCQLQVGIPLIHKDQGLANLIKIPNISIEPLP